ncbi:hypothetical protein WA158_003756 [Blastocystis sp. Blastoise]
MSKLFSEYISLLAEKDIHVSSEKIQPISTDDALIVVDFQNDFVPAEYANDGGRFGVNDGQNAFPATLDLIRFFTDKKCTILASKDYHPEDHCSFTPYGGPFPPHCVQGTAGAENHADLHIIYKSFMKETDSFSSFPYTQELAENRISYKSDFLCWTGGYELKSSTSSIDIDSKPDVSSILNRIPTTTILEGKKRVFVCGLAFDFCVFDTAIGASMNGFETYIVMDATRAAHIPGVGSEGSGFLSSISEIKEKLTKYNIHLVYSDTILA